MSTVMQSYSAILPTDFPEDDSPFATDRFVEEAIHRAETGRRTWKLLAVVVMLTVLVIALASA